MITNATSELPEEPQMICTKCNKELLVCDGCEYDFDDGEDILCYNGKHYCEDCAEEIK